MNLLGVPFALRNNTGMTVLIVVLILIIGFGMDIMLLIGRHFAVIVKIYKLWMNIYFDYFWICWKYFVIIMLTNSDQMPTPKLYR